MVLNVPNNTYDTFEAWLMKKLSNTEAESEKALLFLKNVQLDASRIITINKKIFIDMF